MRRGHRPSVCPKPGQEACFAKEGTTAHGQEQPGALCLPLELGDSFGLQISCAGRAGGEEDWLAYLSCHKAHGSFQLLPPPGWLPGAHRPCIALEHKSRPDHQAPLTGGTPKERLLLGGRDLLGEGDEGTTLMEEEEWHLLRERAW